MSSDLPLIHAQPSKAHAGAIPAAAGDARHFPASLAASQRAARRRNLYAASIRIHQALARPDAGAGLLDEICRLLVREAGFIRAWAGLMDTPQAEPVTAAACCDNQDAVENGTSGTNTGERDAIRNALREQRPAVGDAPGPSSIRSIAAFPLLWGGRTIGVFSLQAADPGFFDREAVGLLEEVMREVSGVLHSLQVPAEPANAAGCSPAGSETLNGAILSAAPDSIITFNRNGAILGLNQAAEATFGLRSAQVVGRKLADVIVPPEWRQRCRREFESGLCAGPSGALNRRIEFHAVRADGSIFPIELTVVPLGVESGAVFAAFIRDISESKRAERLQLGQNRILNMVATGAPLPEILNEIALFAESQCHDAGAAAILRLDNEGALLSECVAPNLSGAWQAFYRRLAVGPDQGPCGAALFGLAPAIVADIAADPLCESLRADLPRVPFAACCAWPVLGAERKALGAFAFHFHEAVAPDEEDRQLFSICARLAGIAMESRASEERIRYLAHYDGLTSLPNRFLFREHLEGALRAASVHDRKLAVLFLDLDRFKEINDIHGHEAGDLVLKTVAQRMRGCLRHTDKIARMGGDEFYVLIEELADGKYAADVAHKLLQQASRPVRVGDAECRLSVSIGIAIYPADGRDADTLLNNADQAMYRAKELGKDGFQFHANDRKAQR